MQIIHTISEIRTQLLAEKKSGKLIAFVPTMGNLHHGHLQLVKMAKAEADIVICSIFVNPLQFGQGEDFAQYPRTLDSDAQKLQEVGCDIVFAPAVDEMYPHTGGQNHQYGKDTSQVLIPVISDILEGASRPGHFNGVATVVAKLFNMVQPDIAIFGEKDYQQLQVIQQFVRDLCFPVKILAHPIVREPSGLAMSSRNGYLTSEQKQQASKIYQTLRQIESELKKGSKEFAVLVENAQKSLDEQGFVTDYITIKAPDLSEPAEHAKALVILAAVYLGKTRLLDNIQISL